MAKRRKKVTSKRHLHTHMHYEKVWFVFVFAAGLVTLGIIITMANITLR